MLKIKTLQEVCKICSNMYRLGWDERNGGNVSVILLDEEVKEVENLPVKNVIKLNFDASGLAGKYVLVTGTGKYFKNVEADPENNLGIIRITSDGNNAEVVWGFNDGGRPTSELPTHLKNHIARLSVNKNNRVVIHTHATYTTALSMALPEDEDEITKTLWKMQTESIVVFPEGIGYLPWMVCGGNEIGEATSEKIKKYREVIWGMHGVFGVGESIDEAFGLIETVEKAAQLYFIVKDNLKQCITNDQLKAVAKAFNLNYKPII